MNPEELKALLSKIVQGIMQVMQSGEVLSDELQGLLAQTIAEILNRIEQAQAIPTTEAPISKEINPAMPSSNVEGSAYDDKSGKLYVRFVGKHPNRNGPIYEYEGVPKVIFNLFRQGAVPARTDGRNKWGEWWKGKVPSMGASVYTLLRLGGYPYQKVA